MRHVTLPDDGGRQLPFYLAMEEWIALNLPAGDWFFTWRVSPTLIFGRNQNIEAEVDIDYCRRNGIGFYRRKSGGGCVYADMDNIMMSYITASGDDVQTIFSRYTSMVAGMLSSLGLEASATGRNDVYIGTRKVSGNAFYRLPGRSIVHGTMLFSTDMGHMLRAITPSRSKMESKQVQSVAAHVTTISEHLPGLTIDDFGRHAVSALTTGVPLELTPLQVAQIESMEQGYRSEEWIRHGRTHRLSGSAVRSVSGRVSGVGELNVSVALSADGRNIADAAIDGDFFPLSDGASAELMSFLRGVPLSVDGIVRALKGVDASRYIAGLDTEILAEFLTDNILNPT